MKKAIFLLLLLGLSISLSAQSNDTICYHYYYANESTELATRQVNMNDVILVFVNKGKECYYYGNSDDFMDARDGFLPGFITLKAENLVMGNGKISFTLDSEDLDFYSQPIGLDKHSKSDILSSGYHRWLQPAFNAWGKAKLEGTYNDSTMTLVNKTFASYDSMVFYKESFEYAKSVYNRSLMTKEDERSNRNLGEIPSDAVGLQTIRAFYEKYAFLTDEQSKAFRKSKSKDAFLAYEKQVGDLARTYCTESFMHKWQASEMADLLTDENPIDGLAAKTLTVKCVDDHYVVSYSAHTDCHKTDSPIVNVTFEVYLDNAGKIVKVVGNNLGDTDEYSVSEEARPDKLASLSVADLSKGKKMSWLVSGNELSKDGLQKVSWTFSDTTLDISSVVSGKERIVGNYRYYVTANEPTKYDSQKEGNRNRGSFLVIYDTANKDFFYFSITEFDASKGMLTLFNDNKVDLPGVSTICKLKTEAYDQ